MYCRIGTSKAKIIRHIAYMKNIDISIFDYKDFRWCSITHYYSFGIRPNKITSIVLSQYPKVGFEGPEVTFSHLYKYLTSEECTAK